MSKMDFEVECAYQYFFKWYDEFPIEVVKTKEDWIIIKTPANYLDPPHTVFRFHLQKER